MCYELAILVRVVEVRLRLHPSPGDAAECGASAPKGYDDLDNGGVRTPSPRYGSGRIDVRANPRGERLVAHARVRRTALRVGLTDERAVHAGSHRVADRAHRLRGDVVRNVEGARRCATAQVARRGAPAPREVGDGEVELVGEARTRVRILVVRRRPWAMAACDDRLARRRSAALVVQRARP